MSNTLTLKRSAFRQKVRLCEKVLEVDSMQGNIALYVAFILPVTMVLLIVSIEISSWQYLREEAQREADRIVLQAAQQLPYAEDVSATLLAEAERFNQSRATSPNGNLTIPIEQIGRSISPSMVSLRIEGVQRSSLDFLMAAKTGERVLFPVAQEARARVVPVDAVLIFSDARSLRPLVDIANPPSSNWGAATDWPLSPYFNFALAPGIDFSLFPPPVAPLSWPEWWLDANFNTPAFQRWLTQLCYNPSITPLKSAALMVADTFSVSNENRLAVYASPGDRSGPQSPGYSEIRSLAFPGDPRGRDRIFWSNYFEAQTGNSDEGCLYYGSRRYAADNPYAIPRHGVSALSESACDTVIENPPESSFHYPSPLNSRLSSCFRQDGGALLRELIYYRAVREHAHEIGAANIARSFRASVGALLEEDWIDRGSSVNLRSSLAANSVKIVIIISDALPDSADPVMSEALGYLANDNRMKAYIIGYNHQGLNQISRNFLAASIATYEGIPGVIFSLADETNLQALIRGILIAERRVVLSS
ncbi:MAG TPA: Tad domain-containing protein [Oligoflexia bacterium]|nr:Tad domain-containing protein [Oligoflexia bacterium]HMP49397.1 Tad domain-containing protein [Oligoflexia bacterium]